MQANNNPLRQYFRRPSIYLKLPSGGNFYKPGAVDLPENGEIPIFPMTAIDDITAKTPDALFNGQAVVDIIKSCAPNIKDPWQINSIDLDAVLVAIRSASNSDGLSISSTCPECLEESEFEVSLGGLLAGIKKPEYQQGLTVSDLTIFFKPLTFKEVNEVSLAQFNMQRAFNVIESIQDMEEKTKKGREALAMITDATMKTIAKTISHIDSPTGTVNDLNFILDFLQNCDKQTYDIIKDYNAKLREQSEIKPLNITCPKCNHKYNQAFTLNVTDFFG
jgi:hypothetical protein